MEKKKTIESEPRKQRVIPLAREEVRVAKRRSTTGIARISKIVREKVEVVDEPLRKDELQVERVQVNRFVDRPMPVREEDGTMIVPVLEEVLVTEKRILLREELRIRKVVRTLSKPQKILLRREEAVVEKLKSGASGRKAR